MADRTIEGIAGLTICESLLLALVDVEVLSDDEVYNLLLDAENAHRNAGGSDEAVETHREIADVIRKVRNRADGVAAVAAREKSDNGE